MNMIALTIIQTKLHPNYQNAWLNLNFSVTTASYYTPKFGLIGSGMAPDYDNTFFSSFKS